MPGRVSPLTRTAARAAAAELVAVTCFQVAVAAGAPWGRWTQGGGTAGVLPVPQRVAAGASAGLLLTWAAALLARVGEGPARGAPPRVTARLACAAASYAVVGTAMNAASRSPHERAPWTPASALLAVLAGLAVRGSRPHHR